MSDVIRKWRPIGVAAVTFGILAFLAADAVMMAVRPVQAAEDAEFVGHQQCKVCHNKSSEGEQWNVWKEMNHANAYELLKGDEAKAVAKELGMETPPHESPDCLKCHVTGYDPATGDAPAKIDLADGVQCESCHGASSVHIDFAKKFTFQKDEAAREQSIAALHDPNAETCTQCHNEESPTWKPDRYTLESGEKVGFDFMQAYEKIAHDDPTTEKTVDN